MLQRFQLTCYLEAFFDGICMHFDIPALTKIKLRQLIFDPN